MYDITTETIACCQLSRIFGASPVVGHRLIKATGSASEVFSMRAGDLKELLGTVPPPGLCNEGLKQSARELEKLSSDSCTFIGITGKGYPQLLAECEDAPLGLYVKSQSAIEDIFMKKPYIAVVGTRDVSHYGMEWCSRLTSAVCTSSDSPCIVSGLALGTDIIAHKTALENGCPTIAVMATGIDSIYPRMHSYYADLILQSPGSALVTDYPPGTKPLSYNFLRRNRLIAGLCQATILIESKIKGGGLCTANLAYSYNREVYVLPGKADDIRSGGCNKLISDKKAEIILSEDDLMEKIGLSPSHKQAVKKDRAINLPDGLCSEDDTSIVKTILDLVRFNRGISKTELCQRAGRNISDVSGIILYLESEGLISSDIFGNCIAKDTGRR